MIKCPLRGVAPTVTADVLLYYCSTVSVSRSLYRAFGSTLLPDLHCDGVYGLHAVSYSVARVYRRLMPYTLTCTSVRMTDTQASVQQPAATNQPPSPSLIPYTN